MSGANFNDDTAAEVEGSVPVVNKMVAKMQLTQNNGQMDIFKCDHRCFEVCANEIDKLYY